MNKIEILIIVCCIAVASVLSWTFTVGQRPKTDCLKWEHVMIKHGDHQHPFLKCMKSEPHWTPAEDAVPE